MTEQRFGAAALRLAALSARILCWRPDDFWRATPAELMASLAPPAGGAGTLGRDELTRMMEQDHD